MHSSSVHCFCWAKTIPIENTSIIAASLNLDVNQVRVITNATGGAFGGREEPTVQVHAALGTLITGKPVHMAMDRNDVMLRTIKRHAEIMQYKIGAKCLGSG